MTTRLRVSASLLLVSCLSTIVFGADGPGFPDTVRSPPQVQVDPDQPLTREDLAEADFESASGTVTRRGFHLRRWFKYVPAAGEPALGDSNGSEERIWKAVSGALQSVGWKIVFVDPSKSPAVFSLAETWLRLTMDAPQGAVNYELIRTAAVANRLVHPSPGAKPETFEARAASVLG
jgi:hypothetical protein